MTQAIGIAGDLPAGRLRRGFALTALAALSYGSLPSLVKLAYDGGADETTVMLFRSVSAALVSTLLARAASKTVIPMRGLRLAGIGIGLVWLIGAYAYVAAIRRIPVGVAVTIFYLFPLIVALLARVVEGERLTRARLVGLFGGFAGVALAVGASLGGVDPLGMALAGAASLGVAVNISVSVRVMRGSSPYAAMVMMTAGSAVVLTLITLATGLKLPTTNLSWFGLVAATAIFCVAMVCFYTAINIVGGVRAAMVCNLEPVVATTFAFLVLGEALGPFQLLGVALVIAAVMMVQLGGRAGGKLGGGEPVA